MITDSPLRESVAVAHPTGWRSHGLVITALVSSALICILFLRLFPLHIAGVSYKLQSFAGQKNNFDVLFVGTSRVYHGISPRVFDARAKKLGFDSHSFNAGLDGMDADEGFSFTRRLLGFHPHRLRYLIFELSGGIGSGTPVGKAPVTERNVYWRDWQSLVVAAHTFVLGMSLRTPNIDGSPYSARRFAFFGPVFGASLRLWARNETGFGEGFARIEQALNSLRHHPFADTPPPPRWNGYAPMSRPMTGEALATYRKSFARACDHPVPHRPDPILKRNLDDFARRLALKKIRVIFLVPPSLESARGSEINCPRDYPLLSYGAIARYPQFYTEENRLDSEHLNDRGAEIFSRALAEDFVRTIRSR